MPNRSNVSWLLGGLCFALACPSFAAEPPAAKAAPPPAKTAPPPATVDFSREAFVIDTLQWTLRFEADGTGARTMRTRVLVQTEGALQQFGQLVLEYNSDFERLEIKGRVIKPDGTKVEIPASDVQDMSSPVSRVAPMYSDIRQKHVIVPGLRPGDVLEYELQFEQFAALAPGHFWAAYFFNRDSIVKSEELRIDVPATRFVNVKSRPEVKPEVREANGRRVHIWKTAHLERSDDSDKKKKRWPITTEPEEPPVQVTTFQSWGEVGDWYAKLESDRRAPDDAIRARVTELTKGLTTSTEKLRAVYGFVAQEFRYVSLSFGAGRYQPHAASEVFGHQYGDCKDKNTLLAAMGDVAGLRVQAALTSVGRKIDPDFPSPLQFDHVISYVRIGAEDVWLDTTTELAPFRMLLAPLRKKHALAVAADGKSVLLTVPAEPATPNVQVMTVEGALNDVGTLDADVRFSFRGDAELLGRLTVRAVPQAKWKDYMQYVASAAGLDGEVSAVDISAITDVQKPLEYRFHITKQNYFNRFGKDPKLGLPLVTLNMPDPDDVEDGKPIELGQLRFEYHLSLRLPAQLEARPPVPVSLTRDYAQYSSRYSLDGATFTGDRTMDLKIDELPADRRNDFQAFRRAVLADLDQKVAVKVGEHTGSEGIAGVETDELLAAAISAYENGDYRASVDLLERVLKAEPEHKSAYEDLGRAYLELGQISKAEAALKKAVKLNPFSPDAYRNLGRVYGAQKRYAEAEQQFRKQIEIVPLDPDSHRALGRALVEQGKYAEGVTQLEKAVAMNADDAWLYVSLGTAQFGLKHPDKGIESFERAAELDPNPQLLIDVATTLAERKTGLDRARHFGESAVATLTAQMRNVRLDRLTLEDLANVHLLAKSWETLGWVHFLKGSTAAAVKYLNAAWQLGQDGTVADRLGQAYQRAGKQELAGEYYALSAADFRPKPDGRRHLVSLLGEAKAQIVLDQQKQRIPNLRSYDVPGAKGDGSAEFFVALAPGHKVAEVRFASGSETLKPLANALKTVRFTMNFPDASETRIVRRGILTCSAGERKPPETPCSFILLNPEDVHSVD